MADWIAGFQNLIPALLIGLGAGLVALGMLLSP